MKRGAPAFNVSKIRNEIRKAEELYDKWALTHPDKAALEARFVAALWRQLVDEAEIRARGTAGAAAPGGEG